MFFVLTIFDAIFISIMMAITIIIVVVAIYGFSAIQWLTAFVLIVCEIVVGLELLV